MSTKISSRKIFVYADWDGLSKPTVMGILKAEPSRGKEIFSFEYNNNWLKSGFSQMIDPQLKLFSGPQYLNDEKINFGIFLDSCPDRWGRVLMQRREAAIAKQEKRAPKILHESDYLLGVFDGHRMGAIRYKANEEDAFLNDNKEMASPPWTSIRELENASLKFEEDNMDDPNYLKWLSLLIAPGSSLGGARPKASVLDPKNNLWIAKFPSKNDTRDVGAWEMVVNELALKSGIHVADGIIKKYNSKHHTYLTKRFDRTNKGNRIHFASAMTLLGYKDGEEGASYLQLAEFLIRNGASANTDLIELWSRIVFNICVKNTDDHLRNHGFLLSDDGWRISPAYDVNPIEYGTGLSLNISETDNALDLDLALEVAQYFYLDKVQAIKIISKIKKSVGHWKEVAKKYRISKSEQEAMSPAFESSTH